MNIIVRKSMAWHGKSIVSVYHTAYFLTFTRELQIPDLQITSKVSLQIKIYLLPLHLVNLFRL